MKRNILIIIIIFLFNLVWLYGISHINRFLVANDLVIYIGKEKPSEEEKNDDTENTVIVTYDGESFEKIGSKIEKYLKDTPLEGHGEYIAKYSVSKNVNPYLIGAIIIVNTNCKYECNAITINCNNVGGIHGNGNGCFGGTYRKYDTLDAGIRDLVDYIANNFYNKDLKSPFNIYTGYGKDSAWAYRVYHNMEILKK